MAKINLMPDLTSPHPLLVRELRRSKLQKFFSSLPESSRHQIDREVREVKKEETRQRRAQHAAEYLMEAMEAELDPPPLMNAAFARNAKAHQGWEIMPQSLRRQHLIAIFRSRFPETRALYLERALLESARYASTHAHPLAPARPPKSQGEPARIRLNQEPRAKG